MKSSEENEEESSEGDEDVWTRGALDETSQGGMRENIHFHSFTVCPLWL